MSTNLPNVNVNISVPFEAQFVDTWGTPLNAALVAFDSEISVKTTNLNFADLELSRPELKDYAETIEENIAISAGVAVVDFQNGNHAEINMSENVTTLTISNPPVTGKVGMMVIDLKQSGVGSFTITWPTSIDWGDAGTPTLTTTSGSTDTFTIRTKDGGTTYQGFLSATGFTTV